MFCPLKQTGEAQIHTFHNSGDLTPQDMKDLVLQSLDSDKAEDIVTIPLADNSALADYMIIASGTSSRHVHALGTKLQERLAARGVRGIRIEGLLQADWIVLDAGDVIVHIFRPEVRSFYGLEKMWSVQAPLHVVQEPLQA